MKQLHKIRRELGKDFSIYDFCYQMARLRRKQNGGELVFRESTRTIMEECRLSKGAAHRRLKRVVDQGWLVPLPSHRSNRQGPISYRLLTYDEWLAAKTGVFQ